MTLIQLEAEMSLARKLESLTTIDAFAGDTTLEQRKDLMRTAIRNGLETVLFRVIDGKHVTMGQQFQKVYGETL